MLTQSQKQQWITALRSGKYVQGKSYLRSADNKFCCLGVLCDILNPEAWDQHCVCFFEHVKARSGTTLSGDYKNLLTPIQCDKLTRMNDCLDRSFDQIAQFIEDNIKAGTQ